MIVSHERRVLFVHVQKTGGITIENVLLDDVPGAERVRGLPGRKHARLGAALREHPDWAGYWTFGFVRNPWARMWSWYAMIQQRGESIAQGDAWVKQRTERNAFWSGVLHDVADFEDFVLRGPDLFPRLRVPQVRYLRTPAKQADFIGRTEHLDHDLAVVCDRLGVPAPEAVPRRNSSGAGDWRVQYTPAMRERVGELFAEDCELFGYTFD